MMHQIGNFVKIAMKARKLEFKATSVGKTFEIPLFTSKDWETFEDILECKCKEIGFACMFVFVSIVQNCLLSIWLVNTFWNQPKHTQIHIFFFHKQKKFLDTNKITKFAFP